jgi:hypothetical protein
MTSKNISPDIPQLLQIAIDRRRFHDQPTEGVRLISGDSDSLPGVFLDLYGGDELFLGLETVAALSFEQEITRFLESEFPHKKVTVDRLENKQERNVEDVRIFFPFETSRSREVFTAYIHKKFHPLSHFKLLEAGTNFAENCLSLSKLFPQADFTFLTETTNIKTDEDSNVVVLERESLNEELRLMTASRMTYDFVVFQPHQKLIKDAAVTQGEFGRNYRPCTKHIETPLTHSMQLIKTGGMMMFTVLLPEQSRRKKYLQEFVSRAAERSSREFETVHEITGCSVDAPLVYGNADKWVHQTVILKMSN